jgi:hypothetical protein
VELGLLFFLLLSLFLTFLAGAGFFEDFDRIKGYEFEECKYYKGAN